MLKAAFDLIVLLLLSGWIHVPNRNCMQGLAVLSSFSANVCNSKLGSEYSSYANALGALVTKTMAEAV